MICCLFRSENWEIVMIVEVALMTLIVRSQSKRDLQRMDNCIRTDAKTYETMALPVAELLRGMQAMKRLSKLDVPVQTVQIRVICHTASSVWLCARP